MPLCTYHSRRWGIENGPLKSAERAMREWGRSQPPALNAYRFSLIGLSPLLRLEMAYGLQKREDLGSNLDPRSIRQIVQVLAEDGTSIVLRDDQLAGHYNRQPNPHAVFRQLSWAVRCGYTEFTGSDPWTQNSIDLRAIGLKGASRTGRRRQAGVVDLSTIPQPWLRDLLRRRTEAERPSSQDFTRWLRGAELAGQGMNRLPGGGRDLATLEFAHMQAVFDEISADRRKDGRLCTARYRAGILTKFSALLDFGRFSGLLDEVPGSFARRSSHRLPLEDSNEEEIGKAIPEPVIRQLDAEVDSFKPDTYGQLSQEEIAEMFRALYVVLRDSGRRPLEVVSLSRNCLERKGDEAELVWDNHKGRRRRRRLPVVSSTVTAIERWQKIRDQISAPAQSDGYLFPAMTDYSGFDHMASVTLSLNLRKWVDNIPELNSDVLDSEGNLLPFDRSLVFPYAFRHSFAQRHADADTPLDVLKELMDHEDPKTTMGYYRVTLERKRKAVKTVSLQVIDRHGSSKPCSARSYEQRSVAVPFGGCVEPSNVKAGGHACPIRFQCSGCGFYRPDPSYLVAIEDHANSLRADREIAQAMDAAPFVIDNFTAQINAYQNIAQNMRDAMAELPAEDRAELEAASTVLRRVRAGGDRALLPLTVIQKAES